MNLILVSNAIFAFRYHLTSSRGSASPRPDPPGLGQGRDRAFVSMEFGGASRPQQNEDARRTGASGQAPVRIGETLGEMEGDDEPPPSPLFVEGGAPAFTSELVPSGFGVDAGGAHGSPNAPAFLQMGAPLGGAEPTLVQPTLFSYNANDLVWARTGTKGNQPFWPVSATSKTLT